MPNYKVVDADVLDADLTAVADAIRSKTGGADPMTLDEMAVAVEGIQTGGGGATDTRFKELVDGTITEINDSETTVIGERALTYRPLLKHVNFPNVKEIKEQGLYICQRLETAIFPSVTKVGQQAFCQAAVENIEFPLATSVSSQAFSSCKNLKRAVFVSCTSSLSSAFNSCSALELVDGSFASIASAFTKCSSLKTLVLRRTVAICALSNTNAFTGTPFASGGTGGTVYVPQALIEQYQTATNWSTLYAAGTCTFLPIEGSEYE